MSATIIDLSGQIRASADAPPPVPRPSAGDDLRRARIRISQLERDLTLAMRDCLVHYQRAERLERRLAELEPEVRSG